MYTYFNAIVILAALLLDPSTSYADFVVSGISPSQWQATDFFTWASSRFHDFWIREYFVALWSYNCYQLGKSATNTLPGLFDPRNTVSGGSDPIGTAFLAGLWDGTHVLLNRSNNSMAGDTIYETTLWGDVTFSFSSGISQFGVSLQNNVAQSYL
ncbi:MAG: hypothetical protein U0930_12865 [Pirellulales bacterium]